MPTAKLYDGEQDFNEFVLHCADFLGRHGLTLTAKLAKTQKCPKWCDYGVVKDESFAYPNKHNHGPQYRVVIRRKGIPQPSKFLMKHGQRPSKISFGYWAPMSGPVFNEIFEAEVLAWLSDTVRCMEPMAAVDEHVAARAHRFFTDAELRELRELK